MPESEKKCKHAQASLSTSQKQGQNYNTIAPSAVSIFKIFNYAFIE